MTLYIYPAFMLRYPSIINNRMPYLNKSINIPIVIAKFNLSIHFTKTLKDNAVDN